MSAKTLDELWADYEAANVRHLKTAKEITRTYNVYVRPVFGGKRIDKINFSMVQLWHREMKVAPFMINRALNLFRSLFKYAQAMELLPYGHNPARLVKFHPEKKRTRHLSAQEAAMIANELILREEHRPEFTALIWLAIFTGARSGELRKAQWKHLKGNVLTLTIHKTDGSGKDRIIILPEFAIHKLDKIFPVAKRHPEGHICPITQSSLSSTWNNFRKKIGLPDLRIHDLRHTFATYALDKGFTLGQIGQALGHASIQTTKIYAEMSNKNRHRIAAHVSLDILHDMKIIEAGHNEFKDLWK